MAQVHGVYYITEDSRILAEDFREKGREPETADEIAIEFDCPVCDEEQAGRFPSPLSENQQYTCKGSCNETYFLYPMTTIESGRSILTMTIEDRVETQLTSVEHYYPIDRSVGTAGVEMLDEAKVGVMGLLAVTLGFMGVLFYATTIELTALNATSISFMLITAGVGVGTFAVLQGAVAPVFRGYLSYRNVRGRVSYSFPTFMRHAANYHHRKPF